MLYTTIKLLRDHGACNNAPDYRLDHLITGLKERGIDVRKKIPFPLALEISGFDDVLWGLRTSKPFKDVNYIARKFAIECAKHVLHIYEKEYPNDYRPRKCIEAAEAYYLRGDISTEDFKKYEVATRAAAWAAARAAGAARAAENNWQEEKLVQIVDDYYRK